MQIQIVKKMACKYIPSNKLVSQLNRGNQDIIKYYEIGIFFPNGIWNYIRPTIDNIDNTRMLAYIV